MSEKLLDGLEIAQRAVSMALDAGASAAEAVVNDERSALTRFANNEIHRLRNNAAQSRLQESFGGGINRCEGIGNFPAALRERFVFRMKNFKTAAAALDLAVHPQLCPHGKRIFLRRAKMKKPQRDTAARIP